MYEVRNAAVPIHRERPVVFPTGLLVPNASTRWGDGRYAALIIPSSRPKNVRRREKRRREPSDLRRTLLDQKRDPEFWRDPFRVAVLGERVTPVIRVE
jgi:hypothetical protein